MFLIAGNHDAANKMTKSLTLPDNVRFLSDRRPETIPLENVGVAIHGQGFAKQAVFDDLSAAYPAPSPACSTSACCTLADGFGRA